MRTDLTILISLETDEHALARLRELCPHGEVRGGPWLNEPGQTMAPELMKGAEVLLCELPPANFDEFDSLKWIQLESVGYSHVLHLPLLERGIRVTNGLGIYDIPVAEWNIMTMLMCHRHMLDILRNQREKKWDRDARFQAELRGLTVGFYGYGGIARETARIAKCMGFVIWALTRDGRTGKREMKHCEPGTGDPQGVLPDRAFGHAQSEEFLSGVDFLVISLPLTPATRGIIRERELRMLKPSAVLLNAARAEIIDQEAFVRCLREGWIRGAALDVHYAYPLPAEHPLWSMPNLILTPHISGSCASTHFIERVYNLFTRNVQRYCKGEPLLNELTESQLNGT